MIINVASRIFGRAAANRISASKIAAFVKLPDGIYAVTTLSFLNSLIDSKIQSKDDSGSICEVGELSTGSRIIDTQLSDYLLGCFRLSDETSFADSFDAGWEIGSPVVGLYSEVMLDESETLSAFITNLRVNMRANSSTVPLGFSRMKINGKNGQGKVIGPDLLGSRCLMNGSLVGITVGYNAEFREIYTVSLIDLANSLNNLGVDFVTADEAVEHNNPTHTESIVEIVSLKELFNIVQRSPDGVPNAERKIEALLRTSLTQKSGEWIVNLEQFVLEAGQLKVGIDCRNDLLVLADEDNTTYINLSNYIELLSQNMEIAH